MTNQTRRAFLEESALALAATCARRAWAKDDSLSPTLAQMAAMRATAKRFMSAYDVPGMSISIARHGSIVYGQAFGVANKNTKEQVHPSHLFRIASVTKPITSVAIYTLVQQGLLKTSDFVFGPRGILKNDFGATANRPHVDELKIEHLLTHTGGGWPNDMTDPMFQHPQMNHRELISWTIANVSLTHPPVTHYAYSNFGYCVLGRVIEKITQQSYTDFVTMHILSRCGVMDMRIAGNTLADRMPNEVVYYGQGEDPYNMNVRRMDSHGGWLATASDLVRFCTHVDGFKTTPQLLQPETITAMTTATEANNKYAHGWFVDASGNWSHGGSLPGTTTTMMRTRSGICWAALTNTRRWDEGDDALENMLWEMTRSVPEWQA
jgi:CubicO group peptidase (beta-lactamase class C family)